MDYIIKQAEERARSPFHSPREDMPEVLKADHLNYDAYREIRFKRDLALWRADNLNFCIEFFHPGYLFQEPVRLFEFTNTHMQRIRFSKEFFDYGKLDIQDKIPVETGYAGIKILNPLNVPGQMDELAVFQGASYFRVLGKGQRYGQSTRGLALDCGETDRPEEFPLFTDFYLGKPAAGSSELVLYSILDSVSCTGAYRFTFHPGDSTAVDVDATVFFRKGVKTSGVAPLTSMYWFGENCERKPDDYRGEVHDSDGLLMQLSGETVWRPLNNHKELRHSIFATTSPRGFGLLQRDREYANYQEIFNLYHQVPSLFIKPTGDWGEGEIHLVELATKDEYLDNIVAFWNPKVKPEPGRPFHFAYQLQSRMGSELELSPNYVKSTRVGAALHNAKVRQFAIDFTGPALDELTEKNPPVAVASCSPNAHFSENQVIKNPFDKSWRVVLKLEPNADNIDPVSLRVTLKKDDKTVSETWDYLWSPQS